MSTRALSDRMGRVTRAMAAFDQFFADSAWARRPADRPIYDFTFGNPQEPPPAGYSAALARAAVPQHPGWFAYTFNNPDARHVVAASLVERRGVPFADEDICLTNGAFAGLTVALTALTDPGDEVIFISPPWFFYEALIAAAGATPVRVRCNLHTFDLDLAAVAAVLGPRTRAIIVNSPHNPTGTIYGPETLRGLGALLANASTRNGRPIYLLSDEAYSRIIFDDRPYHSPTAFYPYGLIIYTYGKTLLNPGQRIGYIAIPPDCPEREALREQLFAAQLVTGFAFPNALLQHALPEIEPLVIDIAHLQRKRDRLADALHTLGYHPHIPASTFYLLVRSPWEDDRAFADLLAQHDIYCLPGSVCELPGYLRISLTASDTMIDHALPGFAAALAQADERVGGRPDLHR